MEFYLEVLFIHMYVFISFIHKKVIDNQRSLPFVGLYCKGINRKYLIFSFDYENVENVLCCFHFPKPQVKQGKCFFKLCSNTNLTFEQSINHASIFFFQNVYLSFLIVGYIIKVKINLSQLAKLSS